MKCPRCKSEDISNDTSLKTIGAGTIFNSRICNNCGWEGTFFIED